MATYTQNYNLRKIDLKDAPPDITVLNANWDIVDEELQNINEELQALAFGSTKVVSVYLPANAWKGTDIFSQSITIQGVTSNTKVDLQPDSTALMHLIDAGVSALYIANNNGALTAYAIGAAPTTNLTLQATVMEVE